MSSKKVFYHGFNDIQAANIVKNLRDLHDWEPVYMCGADDQSIKQYLGENIIFIPFIPKVHFFLTCIHVIVMHNFFS